MSGARETRARGQPGGVCQVMSALDNFYWRRWAAVAAANGWRMVRGRLACDVADNRARSEHHALVWREADRLALQGHCAVSAEVLRHACHRVAAGIDFSHADVKPAWMDRLIGLWGNGRGGRLAVVGLLIDPLDLVSLDWFENAQERGGRRRREYRVRTAAPAEYVRRIIEDRFPDAVTVADGLQPVQSSLNARQLAQMTITMSERTEHFEQPIGQPKPAVESVDVASENCPF